MARRHFRFAARVLEHLGAELISSDDVALYELVKNGFDAAPNRGEPTTVKVLVDFWLEIETVRRIRSYLMTEFPEPARRVNKTDILGVLKVANQSDSFGAYLNDEQMASLDAVFPAKGVVEDFCRAVGDVNSITVADQGVGMSAEELDRYFLTIGTSHRLNEHRRHANSGDPYERGGPPTGEKGIGRLSMMRLGHEAVVRTCQLNETRMHVLTIDWRRFVDNSEAEAQDIDVDIEDEPKTSEFPPHGTSIVIRDLTSDWSLIKTEEVGARFLSKFLDPFRVQRKRQVALMWNGSHITVPKIGAAYLAAAPNGLKATIRIGRAGQFSVLVEYWFTTESGVRKTISRSYSSLDFGGVNARDVAKAGPFEVELYHYNRRRLAAIPGIATREEFKEWLDEWCGGLKLYRDGVRVMPYGQGDTKSAISRTYDDWLGLDSKALRGKGYSVNRIQIVGCVRISRGTNPQLRDQSNREGLVDNDASRTFITLLQEIVRNFTTEINQQSRPSEGDLSELHDAAVRVQDAFEVAVGELIEAAAEGDSTAVRTSREQLQQAVADVRVVLDDTQRALEDRQLNRIEVLELAATGVAAEAFAHDLEASLDQALADTSVALSHRGRSESLDATLVHLRSVFKSLRVQISSIKPGPAKHRRRRSSFDLVTLLTQIGHFYDGRLERHQVKWQVIVKPKEAQCLVYAVEGHIRQVLDNLVRNSIYWLKETRHKEPSSSPALITVTVDARTRTVQFSDSGIGIAPDDSEWIFGRFHSRRHGGRGLGLYLSKELCEFNGVGLALDGRHKNRWGRLASFVLDFSSCIQGEGR